MFWDVKYTGEYKFILPFTYTENNVIKIREFQYKSVSKEELDAIHKKVLAEIYKAWWKYWEKWFVFLHNFLPTTFEFNPPSRKITDLSALMS